MKAGQTAFALIAAVATLGMATPHTFAASAPPAVYQEGWEAPPSELSEIERRGYHDGVEGARKDYENHRAFDVNNREEYRHPDNVHSRDRKAYREGFRRGYQAGADHLMGGRDRDHRDHDRDHDRD